MSNNSSNIIDNFFDSYGDAIAKVLENRGLSQKWVAENIAEPDQNVQSLQQQISRWIQGSNPSESYRNRIDNLLDISVKKYKSGKWELKELKGSQINEEDVLFKSDSREVSYKDKAKIMTGVAEKLKIYSRDIEATIFKKNLDENEKSLILDGISKRIKEISDRL